VPTGEGRVRFLAFVTAIVERYKDRVSDWQIWNEPNGHVEVNGFAKFTVDVAQTIKKAQPRRS
jgi:beta-glucosidase/6-phospho-beta-glucosidase/beta-galactosidase